MYGREKGVGWGLETENTEMLPSVFLFLSGGEIKEGGE